MQAVVTIKLEKNSKHNPKMKRDGECPLTALIPLMKSYCSDITGQHHSVLIEAQSLSRIAQKARALFGEDVHITRIEQV